MVLENARLVEDVSAAILDHLDGAPGHVEAAALDAIDVVMKHHSCEEETQEFRLQNDREWKAKVDYQKARADSLERALRGLLPYARMVIHSTDSAHDRDHLTRAEAALSAGEA